MPRETNKSDENGDSEIGEQSVLEQAFLACQDLIFVCQKVAPGHSRLRGKISSTKWDNSELEVQCLNIYQKRRITEKALDKKLVRKNLWMRRPPERFEYSKFDLAFS